LLQVLCGKTVVLSTNNIMNFSHDGDLLVPIIPCFSYTALLQVLCGKTVVLSTNQLQFVPMCDLVVVMKAGQVVEVGSYQDLMSNTGGVLATMMKETSVSRVLCAAPNLCRLPACPPEC
jgi:hypothetical protein